MLMDIDDINYFEGIITEVTDVSVSINLKGRMGMMRFPLRMIITDKQLEVGQSIAVYLSYPKVL